jgi:hypothetical protein
MVVVERHPRPGVRAVADAESGLLEGQLLDLHRDRRGPCVGGIGIDLDRCALEQAGLDEALLVVEQQLLAVGRAGANVASRRTASAS